MKYPLCIFFSAWTLTASYWFYFAPSPFKSLKASILTPFWPFFLGKLGQYGDFFVIPVTVLFLLVIISIGINFGAKFWGKLLSTFGILVWFSLGILIIKASR